MNKIKNKISFEELKKKKMNYVQFVPYQNCIEKFFLINSFLHGEFRRKKWDLPFNNLNKISAYLV